MATYQVTQSKSYAGAAGVVDILQLQVPGDEAVLSNLGTSPVYYRTDGIDPSVRGDNSWLLAPGASQIVHIGQRVTEIRTICAAASDIFVGVQV